MTVDATLVLIDGHRMANIRSVTMGSAPSWTWPTCRCRHRQVEVVKDGASAIYVPTPSQAWST